MGPIHSQFTEFSGISILPSGTVSGSQEFYEEFCALCYASTSYILGMRREEGVSHFYFPCCDYCCAIRWLIDVLPCYKACAKHLKHKIRRPPLPATNLLVLTGLSHLISMSVLRRRSRLVKVKSVKVVLWVQESGIWIISIADPSCLVNCLRNWRESQKQLLIPNGNQRSHPQAPVLCKNLCSPLDPCKYFSLNASHIWEIMKKNISCFWNCYFSLSMK